MLADPDYGLRVEQGKARYRATLAVPMLREGQLVGALSLNRSEPGSFTDKHIALVSTFADQAAIAFENVRLFEEVRARTRDLEEALAQQTATAEILRAIARSPSDTRPVFDRIAMTAARHLRCDFAFVIQCDQRFWWAEAAAAPDGTVPFKFQDRHKVDPQEDFPSRAILARETLHLPDWSLVDVPATERVVQENLDVRSSLYLPFVRDKACVGLLILTSRRAHAFGPKEIAIAESLRDQALIAIENTRLFTETQEALAQQTATADVLKTISRSVFDLDAVLQTLIDTAVRLARGSRGTIFIRQGDMLVGRAFHDNVPASLKAYLVSHPIPLDSDEPVAQAVKQGRLIHVPDMSVYDTETVREARKLAGFGAALWAPLMRDGEAIGVFGVPREQPIPFSEREIELVRTFADQAVIAIENARLFGEVQARTLELQDSLERQNATAEILRVISSSPTDIKPVFDAICATAARLFDCFITGVFWVEGGALTALSGSFSDRLFEPHEMAPGMPLEAGHNYPALAAVEKRTVYVRDYRATDPPPHERFISEHYGLICGLYLPLLRKGECIGVFLLTSREADHFDERDIALAESFRDQAMIAVENTRLFNETQEALAQQTATAEVLKTISRSAFDLQKVLDTLLASAVALSGAHIGVIYLQRDAAFYVRAHNDPEAEPEFLTMLKQLPQRAGRGSVGARVLLTGETQNIADSRLDPEYDPVLLAATVSRALLGVPLKRDGETVGAIVLARRTPGLFAPRQIELAEGFADQAVIAIENARLLDEVQARTRELEQSLADLRKAQDRLVQSEKLASLGQLTAGIAHEIKNPLNFVNNFASLSRELVAEMKEALTRRESGEVEELADLIDSNLEKVVHHGRRADSIVKNMLLHSREGSGERGRVSVNAMVEEALNLAYHGARAEKPGFQVSLEKALDPATGDAELYLQEITRVLLNLIGNGFYATAKRRETEGPDYQPTLKASTRSLGDRVEIRIRDNGAGVPDEVRAKMFNPFFTTKPAGEGTGLGLSLSHDIVVKQHGGTLEVETVRGEFAEFIVTLPRGGAGS